MIPERYARLALPALLLAVAGAYAGSASAGWYWDDARLILANPVVQDANVAAAFRHHLWWGAVGDPTDGVVYWRPLVLVSFMLDRLLGGSATVAHLHSLAWHLAAVALTRTLARPRLGPARALVAAAVLGLHPVATGAVLWVAARNDLMVTVFLLGTLVALDRGRPVPAAILAALAGMSKEVGLLAPLVALGWVVTFPPAKPGLRAVAIGTGVALAGRLLADVPPSTWSFDLHSLLVGGLASLSWLGLPWPLTGAVWLPAEGVARCVPGLLALAGLLVVFRPALPGLWAIAVLLFAPALLATAATDTAGEWYLYAPLAFAALAVSAGRARALPLLAPLAVVSLVAIGLRIAEWADPTSLAEALVTRAPSSWSWARLGSVYEANGRVDDALDAYRTGLRMQPTFTRACAAPVRLLERERREELAVFRGEFGCAR